MKLIDPDEKYLDGYKQAYLMSLQMVKQGKMKEHDVMFYNPDEKDVIRVLYDHRDPSKLKKGHVLSYDYFFVDGENFLGRISVRTSLTEELSKIGGNIGYGINPLFWNNGYGNEILKLGLEKVKELGLKKVLITCDDDNIASAKIIEKNGGVLEDIVRNNVAGEEISTRRYWVDL